MTTILILERNDFRGGVTSDGKFELNGFNYVLDQLGIPQGNWKHINSIEIKVEDFVITHLTKT